MQAKAKWRRPLGPGPLGPTPGTLPLRGCRGHRGSGLSLAGSQQCVSLPCGRSSWQHGSWTGSMQCSGVEPESCVAVLTAAGGSARRPGVCLSPSFHLSLVTKSQLPLRPGYKSLPLQVGPEPTLSHGWMWPAAQRASCGSAQRGACCQSLAAQALCCVAGGSWGCQTPGILFPFSVFSGLKI